MSNLPRLIAEKEARDNTRYTQNEIADGVGISRNMLSRLLTGKSDVMKIRLETALSLSQWLECSMDDLVIIEKESSS